QSVAERRGTDETQGPGKCPETETKDPSESKNKSSQSRARKETGPPNGAQEIFTPTPIWSVDLGKTHQTKPQCGLWEWQ
ncbi:MAG: hypothetical protein VX171_10680, partial [Pseudomonadota bacterium]|nr:hypothetical protein [Pseudomonadota bacterium]